MTKVLLCAMAKCENQYIKEWIDWHLELGFDKIVVYDNNDINGERISDVVVPNPKLEIVDWRGKTQSSCGAQVAAYNDCYGKHSSYDWIMFLDIDEFLEFKGGISIKDYLSMDWISKADIIKFHWKCYSDNEYLHKPEGLVTDNYKELCSDQSVNKFTKSIYRYGLRRFNMINVHYCDDNKYKVYYQNGKPAARLKCVNDDNINHDSGWIRHYVTKSVEEFITIKYARRGPGKSKARLSEAFYFRYNKRTPDKEKLFEELYNKLNRKSEHSVTQSNTKLRNFLTKPKPLKKFEPNSERIIKKPQTVIETKKVVTKKVAHEVKKAVPNRIDITKTPAVSKSTNIMKPVTTRRLNSHSNTQYPFGISVCISAWKTEEYIEECLDSVANQTWFKTHDNWEVLLGIDACQETLNKVKQVMHKYKNLKVMMMDKNVGTYVTCNTIMNEAEYEWLLRFDSDDVMYPNMIDTLLSSIKGTNTDMITPKCSDGSKLGLWAEGQIFIKKVTFLKYGGFKEFRCGCDTEFRVRTKDLIIQKSLVTTVFFRRPHENSLTSAPDTKYNSDYRVKVKEYINKISPKTPIIKLVTSPFKYIRLNKLIVSFTTWKLRHESAAKMLDNFKNQTLKPDKIYCWLSSEEYGGENIPKCLQRFVDDKFIELRWITKNTYCHKRYEVFKEHSNDYVFLIDDDIYYENSYLKDMYDAAKSHPNNIICYLGNNIEFHKDRTLTKLINNPSVKNTILSGLSCYPPGVFPMEYFTELDIRDSICPKCDDSFLRVLAIKNDIPTYCIYDRSEKSFRTIQGTQEVGIWNRINSKKINGLSAQTIIFKKLIKELGITDKCKLLWKKLVI